MPRKKYKKRRLSTDTTENQAGIIHVVPSIIWGAMLYNSLPTKLRKTEDFDIFKKELFMFVLSNSIDK